MLRSLFLLAIFLAFTECKEQCCDQIGCFNDSAPFNHLPLPKCPDRLGVSLDVYTQTHNTKRKAQELDKNSIPPIWQATNRTIFLVHGFMQGDGAGWLTQIKNQLLDMAEFNVVIVDWNRGARNPYYPYSATNVRTVGAELGLIAEHLVDVGGTTSSNLHCIGLGLGAHVCGHAGMRTAFGRVTGLDPAGPWFDNKPDEIGLNPSSAALVDVIHTNGEPGLSLFHSIGTLKPMGHVDFYPNGGGSQPGCHIDVYAHMAIDGAAESEVESQGSKVDEPDVDGPKDEGPEVNGPHGNSMGSRSAPVDEGLPYGLVLAIGKDGYVKLLRGGDEEPSAMRGVGGNCSHMRVIDLFLETLSSECNFAATSTCTDHRQIPGSCVSCGNGCPTMGLTAGESSDRGLFYMETNRRKPYCL